MYGPWLVRNLQMYLARLILDCGSVSRSHSEGKNHGRSKVGLKQSSFLAWFKSPTYLAEELMAQI